ncbi:hypothetical protein GCM10022197_36860 [Microlunatus spumicola]|uniref:Uncharacterized protein n=1 Tax=Microlunatus spumicola TaxID=81499 RepID=A0ABP6Y253_9ACTN
MLQRTTRPTSSGVTARATAPAHDLWFAPPRARVRQEPLRLVPPLVARPERVEDPYGDAEPAELPTMSDAERAVMDDLFRQASRLSAVAAWVGVAVVMAVVALLVLR